MKLPRIAALAVITLAPLLAAAATIIEPTVPGSTPQSTPPGGAAPAPTVEAPPPPRPPQNEMRAARDADARQCLTLATNRQVHACAERYRNRAARVRAAKTTKPAVAGEMVKAAESSKAPAKPAAGAPPDAIVLKPPGMKPPPEPPKPAADPSKGAVQPPKTSDVVKPEPPKAPASAPPQKSEPTKK